MSPIFGRGGGDYKVESLKKVPIFSRCSSKELKFLASEMDEVDVGEGTTLISQGNQNHTFHILIDGQAEVTIGGSTVAALGPGDFFGEISMMDRGPATATVVTKTPAHLMVMSHEQFRDAVKSDDDVFSGVMSAIAERLRADELEGTRAL